MNDSQVDMGSKVHEDTPQPLLVLAKEARRKATG